MSYLTASASIDSNDSMLSRAMPMILAIAPYLSAIAAMLNAWFEL